MEVTREFNELEVSMINGNLGPFLLFRLCVALIALIWALFTHETGITQHVGNRARPPMAMKDPMTFLSVGQPNTDGRPGSCRVLQRGGYTSSLCKAGTTFLLGVCS